MGKRESMVGKVEGQGWEKREVNGGNKGECQG